MTEAPRLQITTQSTHKNQATPWPALRADIIGLVHRRKAEGTIPAFLPNPIAET